MKETRKITIITASYNAATTIEQTISSIVHQDYSNLEYIIVDGGSIDGTVEIIKKYEPYGIKWISEPDQGLYDALNKGIRMSTGDFIEIIGADDALVKEDIISQIVCQLESDVDVLCGQVWCVDDRNKTQHISTNETVKNQGNYHGGMTPHAAMFVRRELLIRYPFDTNYRIAADYKFFLQCRCDPTVRIRHTEDIVAFFANVGVSSNIEECWKEDNYIHQELNLPFHAPYYTNLSPMKRIIKQALVCTHLFILARTIWNYINTRFFWQKHTCENKICRWCGRKEKDWKQYAERENNVVNNSNFGR